MFSGIVRAIGTVKENSLANSSLRISCPLFLELQPSLGDSIAIDGVCLTVSSIFDDKTLQFNLGEETKKQTLLLKKKYGDLVHIEPSLKAGQSLDGHLVQGHVDGLAQITKKERLPDGNLLMELSFKQELASLIVKKGSIAVNGVSLTVNYVEQNRFGICLIPYTLTHCCFEHYELNELVHIETDIIGRYVLNALQLRNHP